MYQLILELLKLKNLKLDYYDHLHTAPGHDAVRNCNHLHLGLNGYHFSYDIFGQHIRQKSVKQHRIKKIEALALGQSPLGILKELAKMEEDEK